MILSRPQATPFPALYYISKEVNTPSRILFSISIQFVCEIKHLCERDINDFLLMVSMIQQLSKAASKGLCHS